jgi:hypothetical protein
MGQYEDKKANTRISKEGFLSIFIDLKDRAQRFHPSKFCGSLFARPLAAGAASLIK